MFTLTIHYPSRLPGRGRAHPIPASFVAAWLSWGALGCECGSEPAEVSPPVAEPEPGVTVPANTQDDAPVDDPAPFHDRGGGDLSPGEFRAAFEASPARIDELTAELAVSPDDVEIMTELGVMINERLVIARPRGERLERYLTQGQQVLEHAYELAPDHSGVQLALADFYLDRAHVSTFEDEDVEEAVQLLERRMAEDESNAVLATRMVEAYLLLDKQQDAEEWLGHTRELTSPQRVEDMVELKRWEGELAMAQGQLADAEAAFLEAKDLLEAPDWQVPPFFGRPYGHLRGLYHQQGRTTEELEMARAYADVEVFNHEAQAYVAALCTRLGDQACVELYEDRAKQTQ